MRHTVIIPSYNTLNHLKNTYKSLKKYAPEVEIIVIDDASEDGTSEWLLKEVQDDRVQVIISRERRGHTYWYDEGMRLAKTDIVSILHSDMIIGPGYFENMLKHLQKGKVVCATRIEPPIHPPGKEKIVMNFGDDHDNFMWEAFEEFVNSEANSVKDATTKGIFAPWMLYKEDHFAIGGHDQRFAPYGYEDSDIFNRWILAGYEMVQSRDSLCYHMTCRGHRWNKGIGIENSDYKDTMERCRREFLRKWSDWIQNDQYQFPIIYPKYDIGFIIKHCSLNLLNNLEPWANTLYVDEGNVPTMIKNYIDSEQPNTVIDLNERIKPFDNEKNNEILVQIDGSTFTQQDFQMIQQLSGIIKDSGEIGEFQLGNLFISIIQMNEYQNNLIKL